MKKISPVVLFVLGIIITLAAVWWINGYGKKQNAYNVTMSSQTVIKQIQKLNRLETASFTIEKVIEAGKQQNAFSELLFGDRILLIAHGQVIAGFDVSKIGFDVNKKENGWVQTDESGSILEINLPQPQILVTKLDSEQTRVYDRKLGVFTKGNKDLESQARAAAEQAITEAALQGGILQEASKNACSQLKALFVTSGYVTVIVHSPDGSC